MMGVFVPLNSNLEFLQNYDVETEFSKTDYNIYASGFSGYTEITQKKLDEFGYKILAGALPDGTKDEIAISAYVYETFKLGKYTDGTTSPDGRIVYKTIQSPEDLIGKTLNVNGIEYTITGIVDTNMDLERYKPLMEEKTHMSTADQIVNFALMNEFGYEANSSLARIIMVGEGYLSKLIENEPYISPLSSVYVYYYSSQDDMVIDPSYMCKLSDVSSLDITWFDEEKSVLGEKEIVITSDIISSAGMGMPQEDYDNLLKNVQKNSFHMNTYGNGIDFNENEGYKVVGIIEINEKNSKYSGTVVANDKDFEYCIKQEKGDYNFVIGAMPESREDIKNLVAFCYKEDADIQFQLQNAVTYELDTINEMLKVLSKVFLYVGIGFALFASLMLANFIGTSISHKKQEIGILRAIGSRSNDVFRIFFSESFIIAMINFLLSAVGVFVATSIINAVIRKELGVLITVLNFGLRQILLLFVVSLFVATLASFLPVKKIASKKPIDAIRNR
ncbi:MAG: ABC transporter permease [Lachnospiraceae bacterium]|nr:ABC transporter permease [Lachnospiraceae bacterium]